MQEPFDFKDLFVLDLANNHQGSLGHGQNVIRAMANVVNEAGVRAAMKFQFRQLDTFIHPDHQEESEYKYVQRFMSTRLKMDEFKLLLDDVRNAGLLAMCTPFDEESVDVIVSMGFDLIKVASCSAKDWPLLEKVADAGKPVVFSTGGLTTADIDNLVSFFEHRGVHFAIMHCVSIYPTPDEKMALQQISALKERYPGVHVGWSTHEDPGDTVPVQMAVALGAELFERHVGLPTEDVTLNAYSSNPDEVAAWLAAYARARTLVGPQERPAVSQEEQEAIDGLRRGVYAKRDIAAGSRLERDQVFFAIPYLDDQLDSGRFKPGTITGEAVAAGAAVPVGSVSIDEEPEVNVIKHAIHQVKAMLNDARIHLSTDFKIEYSHHYGVANFLETGAVIIECINREYCKKLVVQLPGQSHPSHYHARKEETFQLLYGQLSVKVDGRVRELEPGDTVLVQPGVWHSFWTEQGAIFEEVSTTHYNNDSIYEDKRINRLERAQRKTVVDNWGRFQLGGDVADLRNLRRKATLRCAVFDFDGTLVDSNAIKRGAYHAITKEFDAKGEIVTDVVERCPMGDRFQISRVLAAELVRGHAAPPDLSADDLAKLLVERYTAHTSEAISACDEIEGASDVLLWLQEQRIPIFVNTGTPTEAVTPILKNRGLDAFFDGVHGAPSGKVENLRAIADLLALQPDEMIFIGDGEDDRSAAIEFGCAFIGVALDGQGRFEKAPPHKVTSLAEVTEIIEQMNGA